MACRLLAGKEIARAIKEKIRKEIAALPRDAVVTLAAVEVEGVAGDIRLYASSQRRLAESLGISFRLETVPLETGAAGLVKAIEELNRDDTVNGILLLRPLPPDIDPGSIARTIDPRKDVEGLHPLNLGNLVHTSPTLVPCTAQAAVTIFRTLGVAPRGLETVVVNHSEIVGKPIALLMVNDLATVTICHVGTTDLAAHTRKADLLFVAAGKPNLITGGMVKRGAIVIDIGINRIVVEEEGRKKEKTVGDVEFSSVSRVAGFLTPVPGGVGPVTTAMLMQNTLHAAWLQRSGKESK